MRPSAAEVLLMNPPWASLEHPSLAFGLIKSTLREHGIGAEIRYVNLDFAEAIGVEPYRRLKNHNVLVAEWIFSEVAFGPQRPAEEFLGFIRGLEEDPANVERWGALQRAATKFLPAYAARIDWKRYSVVGFTTSMLQTVPSLALARHARKANPNLKIVFGGANCEGEMGEALIEQFLFIDVVVRGDCDSFVADLFDRLLRGAPLAGLPICYREGDRLRIEPMPPPFLDLDQNPFPDYDDYFEQLHAKTFSDSLHVNLMFEGSRGCWYGDKKPCMFCAVNGSNMTYRAKSPERLGAELSHLSRKYETRWFGAADNIFVHKNRREWAEAIAKAVPAGRFHFGVKSNITRQDLEALCKAGVRDIEPGIESFSTRVLRLISKGVSGIQNVYLLRLCLELSVWPMWNYLFGFPGETMDDYKPILSSNETLFHLPPPTHGLGLSVMRFSAYHRQPENTGIRLLGPLPHYRYIYPFAEEQIARLAYYFHYEHLDGYDPSHVGGLLEEFTQRWREAYNQRGAGLWATCVEDEIWIDDTRSEDQLTHRLLGASVLLYRLLERPGRVDGICRTLRRSAPSAYLAAGGKAGVDRTLAEWNETGLVFCENDNFVALAAPTQGAGFWDPSERWLGEPRRPRPPTPSLVQGSEGEFAV
jgi:ribosomal peptide maturation radical SAM protein 1